MFIIVQGRRAAKRSTVQNTPIKSVDVYRFGQGETHEVDSGKIRPETMRKVCTLFHVSEVSR